MKSILKILLIFTLFSNNIFSQTNLAKTNISKGNFVDAPCSQGGKRKTGVLTFSNGDKFIGEFKNDTLSGLAKKIFVNGTIEQGKWKKGILIEKYDLLEFYKDGCIKESCRNKINGECDVYYPNQKRKSIKYYENSKLKYERFWNEYGDGFKKIVNYDLLGKLNGEYITYNLPTENGENSLTVSIDTIGQYLNGKRVGEWKKKYPGSNLDQSVFIYQDGSIISEIQYKYWNDQNIKEKEVFYLNNKIQKEVTFFENGAIGSQTFYKDGFKVKTTEYDSNGVFRGGKIYEDKYTTYQNYIDGVLRSSTRTSNATLKREGYEISYYSNGKLNYKEFFKDDVSITYEGYFENGQKEYIEDLKKKEKYNENGNLVFYLDKLTKKGQIIYKSGEKWVGEIRDGKKTIGKGTYYYDSGDKYIGTFNSDENIADGPGEYYWQNGNRYIGNFKDGLINGYGKIINVDGSIQEGIFSNGNLVNDYNKKQISSSNTSNKSKQKKYTTPPLHLSTKELGEWFDSEEGQAYLKQSGMLNEVQKRILNPANYNSGSSSSSSSSSSSKLNAYQCSTCAFISMGTMEPAGSEFNNCMMINYSRIHTWLKVNTNGHGTQCSNCGIKYYLRDTLVAFSFGGCSKDINKQHYWVEF